MTGTRRRKKVVGQQACDDWNRKHPLGSKVLRTVKKIHHRKTGFAPVAEAPEAQPDAVGPRLVTDGARKVVFCARDDAGADAYAWLIRTNAGKWLSEPGFSFPAGMRAHGLRSKEAAITPATATQHETEAGAAAAACLAGLEWLNRTANDVTGPAAELVTRVYQALSRWEAGPEPPATLVETLVEQPREEAEIAERTAEIRNGKRRGSRAEAVEPLGQAQGRKTAQAQGRKTAVGRTIVAIAVDKIQTHPHNRRVEMADCAGLAESLERRGLLQPIRVRPLADPIGHYQLVDGERRWRAAQIAGWGEIDAEVVELGDAEAEAEIAAANGQRRPLNEIEMADRLAWLQKPVAAGGGGLTQSLAAAEMGISQPYASLLQSVARLPGCWRKAVISGEIPASFLRPVAAKYGECPEVLDLLWKDYVAASKSRWLEERAVWATRKSIEESIDRIVTDQTRPLTNADKLEAFEYYGVFFDADKLDAATRKKLRIVAVPDGQGQTVQRCFDWKVWQQINAKADRSTSSAKAAKPLGQAQGRKRTPAEQRKADATADAELKQRVQGEGGLAEIALRIDLADRLKPGDYVARNLHDDLVATSRETFHASHLDFDAWKYCAERLLIAERLGKGKTPPKLTIVNYRRKEAYARYSQTAIDWDGDPHTDGERRQWHVCRLLLWPQSEVIEDSTRLTGPDQWPERFVVIVPIVLQLYARITGASIRQTWEAARKPRGAARQWFHRFVGTHNTTRQRVALAKELGLQVDPKAKLQDLADQILTAHQQRGLKLPKILDIPAAKKPRIHP